MKKEIKSSDQKKQQELEKLKRDQELREALIASGDQIIEKRFSDENLDKELLKQFLTDFTRHNPRKRYIRDEIAPYIKKFPLRFYELIYKLQGWPTDKENLYSRPAIIGKWTNDLIYYRFPHGILKTLQEKNPYTATGSRLHKHFQYLTSIGESDLKQFIEDAIRIMEAATNWDHFRRLFAKAYGKPFQGTLFPEKGE